MNPTSLDEITDRCSIFVNRSRSQHDENTCNSSSSFAVNGNLNRLAKCPTGLTADNVPLRHDEGVVGGEPLACDLLADKSVEFRIPESVAA